MSAIRTESSEIQIGAAIAGVIAFIGYMCVIIDALQDFAKDFKSDVASSFFRPGGPDLTKVRQFGICLTRLAVTQN